MQTLAKISVLACCLVSALASVASARKWTDAKGEVIANDAKFVRVFKEKEPKSSSGAPSSTTSGGKAGEIRVLLDYKNRPINKPFLELSTEDQQFIRKELEDKKLSEQLTLLPAPTTTGQPGGMPGMPQPGAMPGMQQPGAMPGMPQPAVNPGATGPAGAEERVWTSTKGTHMQARFLQVNGDKVVLITAEGTRKEVPIAQLSEADQAYVRTAAASPPAATPAPGGSPTTMPPPVSTTGATPGAGPGPGPGYMPPPVSTTGATPGAGPGPGPGYMRPPVSTTGTTPGSSPSSSTMPPPVSTTGATPGAGPGPGPGGMPPTMPATGTTPGSGPGPGPGGMPPPVSTGTTPGGPPATPGTPVPPPMGPSPSGPPSSPPSTSSPPIASTVTSPPATGWATWLLIVVGVVGVGLGGLVGYVIRDRMNTPQPKRR